MCAQRTIGITTNGFWAGLFLLGVFSGIGALLPDGLVAAGPKKASATATTPSTKDSGAAAHSDAPDRLKDRRLRVLFLGDNGHHQPAVRAAELIPVLANRRIDVTYTENCDDLNPGTLGQYDALVLYANHDTITPPQLKSLLDYVASGHGFVPLHCASYCFRNSPEFVALVGAQFQRHGFGPVETDVVEPEHPIMRGWSPFPTEDETYVHTLHNPEHRLVLQTRPEGETAEPWTWVRTHGKGRVFYTAYGHDHRTWSHPGFHDLVERGIRWAAGVTGVYDSWPRTASGLDGDFSYVPAEVPNYVAGKKWGEVGEPISRMQSPLQPAVSLKHLAVPDEFAVELFAAEPDIGKPIAMAWDHRGRLWLCETVDYPNEKQPEGSGRDRIRICEDTDGDGRADRFTVFAEGLSIPTSIAFARGGVVVHQAPETLFFIDTDGDDRADVREVLFTGWDTGDTHAGPSNLRYGLDNWLWGVVGYSGFRGRIGGEMQDFRMGLYRMRPDGQQLEFLRGNNNNCWGLGFTEEGLVLGSTANGNPVVYLPIPNRYYEQVRGWSSSVLGNSAISNTYYPITEKVRQVDFHGGFTSAAGGALYTARTYPSQYWNRTQFVSDPTGHLTATFVLNRKGSDFTAFNAWNMVASDDEWTAPIVAEVGPDGHMWVIDWYNFIIQHNPTPVGYQTGKGNAYEIPLRDKTHGRILRVVYRGAAATPRLKLDPQNARQLVETLSHSNQGWRLHAQRLLVERGQADVKPALLQLIANRQVDELGLNVGAIHALWTLHGLGQITSDKPETLKAVAAALQHPSAGVRRNALAVMPHDEQTVAAILQAHALTDPNPDVRLAGFLALADSPANPLAAAAILAALGEPGNMNDRWIPDAATAAAARQETLLLKALAGQLKPTPAHEALVRRVSEHIARGPQRAELADVFGLLTRTSPVIRKAVLAGLAKGWPANESLSLNESAVQQLVAWLPDLDADAKSLLVGLASRWQLAGFEAATRSLAEDLLAIVTREDVGDVDRGDAARQLIEFRKSDPQAAADLLSVLSPRSSPELAKAVLAAVGVSEAKETGDAVLSRLDSLTPSARPLAVQLLLGRADWTSSLLAGLEAGRIKWGDLTLDQKQSLTNHPQAAIAELALTLLKQGGGLPDANRQKVIDELSPVALSTGDAVHGKLVYQQQCAKCHKHGGAGPGGENIGPDLTGMAAHPKAELLVHILDPSRSVEGNFRLYLASLVDGQTISGLLASENRTAIELVDTQAKRHQIQRSDIEELVASTKSVMPEGFEKQISPADLRDLLEFLTQRGQYVPADLRKVATIVSTRGMFYDSDSPIERLIFSDWSPKTFAGVPFQLIDPQGDRVNNVVLLNGPIGVFPPRMPRSVELPCSMPCRAIHLLSGVSGWGFPAIGEKSVSLIVRLHYADGEIEDHPLRNGVHFADYIRVVDVPESKLAFQLADGQQIRYLSVQPKRAQPLATVELVKGDDDTAPVVMAVTFESR